MEIDLLGGLTERHGENHQKRLSILAFCHGALLFWVWCLAGMTLKWFGF
tara:strand:- start:433 stop:579 length:147 start_codon:yes stop_codon:yes gene_type:complete